MASYPTPPVPLADALKDAHAPHGRLKGEKKTFGEKNLGVSVDLLVGCPESGIEGVFIHKFSRRIGSTATASPFFPERWLAVILYLKESICCKVGFTD